MEEDSNQNPLFALLGSAVHQKLKEAEETLAKVLNQSKQMEEELQDLSKNQHIPMIESPFKAIFEEKQAILKEIEEKIASEAQKQRDLEKESREYKKVQKLIGKDEVTREAV